MNKKTTGAGNAKKSGKPSPKPRKKTAGTASAAAKRKKSAAAAKKTRTAVRARRPVHTSAAKKKCRAKKKYCWWAMPVTVLSLIVIFVCILLEMKECAHYEDFCHMKESVQNQTFYNGVVVESYDVSGYTLSDMLSYWDKNIEAPLREKGLVFNVEGSSFFVSAEELGYRSDYESVLKRAWSSGRDGTLEERYRSVRAISTGSSRYDVTRTLYDKNMLRSITDSVAEKLTYPAYDAAVGGFDFENRTFNFTEASEGRFVDAEKLFKTACDTMNAGGGTVNVTVEAVYPTVTKADLEGKFGMITQAVTNASTSGKNRMSNVKLAVSAIDGTCVEDGETFSFNDTVGKRSSQNGYKVATVYSSGEVTEDYGGGVCQVSTTLWNAAMKANCEMVERHAHSLPVAYVDKGKDATVSWGKQDMKFKNNSGYPMYIVGYVDSKGKVNFEIYGRMFDDGKYIKIQAVLTEKIQPGPTKYVYKESIPSGQQVVVTESRTGYKTETYRIYYNGNGKEITRKLLCKSYYKEAAGRIEYG